MARRRNNQQGGSAPAPAPAPAPPPVAMPAPSLSPSLPPPVAPSSSWKDHPLAIATISVSATLVIGSGLVKDLIIPAYTAQLKNDLADFPRVKQKNEELQAKVEELEAQLATSRTETASALTANTFVHGDPYPVGLEAVRIGDSMKKIDATYRGRPIDKSRKGYWSINRAHPVFSHVTYYYDEKSPDPTVVGILFLVDGLPPSAYRDPYLRNKLTSVLGSYQIDEDGHPYWSTQNYVVRLSDNGYSIDLVRRFKITLKEKKDR